MSEEQALGIVVMGGLFGLLIGLIVAIFFLLTLSRTLESVSPANREMEPGMVWLNLIPLFNLVWMFITVIKLGDSVAKEAAERSLDLADGGKALGIAFAALSVASIIPVLGMLAALASLVVFIIYWVKVAGYKNELKQPAPA